jgi:predicted ATP-grasp superfamily ATP-dependent carboligase
MRITYAAAVVLSALTGVAIAKLPPLTPEQQEAAAQKKQVDAAAAEKQKELLEKAQNRVVEYYKKTKGSSAAGASTAAGKTETTNIPRKAVEGPGTAAPRGGTNQSAEAHSTPAR